MTFQRGVAPDDPQRIPGFLKKELEKIQRAFSAISASWATLTGKPANLTALEALVGAAGQVPYFTGLGALALASLTPYARTLIACANAPAVDAVLGLGPLAVLASPNDATKFLNGAASPAFVAVKGSDLSMADVTTNNVSIAAHGFAPKAPNDGTKFLNGLGVYAVPASGTVFPAVLPTFPTLTATCVLQLSAEPTRCTFTTGKDGFVTLMNDATGLWGSNFPFNGAAPRWIKRAFQSGRPGIQFGPGGAAATKLIAAATRALPQPFTVVLAFQDYTAATSDGNFYRDSNNGPCMFISGGNTWALFGGAVLSSGTLFSNNRTAVQPGRVGAVAVSIQSYNGASSLISNNGLEVTGNAGTTGITGTMHIGGNAANASTATITLYEMLIFSSALSPTDRAAINTYYATAMEITL